MSFQNSIDDLATKIRVASDNNSAISQMLEEQILKDYDAPAIDNFKKVGYLLSLKSRINQKKINIEFNRVLDGDSTFRILNYDYKMYCWAKEKDEKCAFSNFELRVRKAKLSEEEKEKFDKVSKETYERLLKDIQHGL